MFVELNHDIYCVDADYVRRGLACFYMLHHRGEVAVIETGTTHSVCHLHSLLAEKKLLPQQVRYIIPTHVHLDHAGGAGAMMAAFPEASLVVHPKGARHLIDPAKLIAGTIEVYGEEKFHALYGDITPVDAQRVIQADDGLVLDLAGRELLIKDTPGHANHHFCVWDAVSRGWFSGDVFGICYPELRFSDGNFVFPTTTPVQFNPELLIRSIQLLESYKPQTIYLTHFNQLDDIAAGAALLYRQIEEYSHIARRLQDRDNRVDSIERALWDYTLQQLGNFNCNDSRVDYRQLLAMDMQLNAQGLDVWLSRCAA